MRQTPSPPPAGRRSGIINVTYPLITGSLRLSMLAHASALESPRRPVVFPLAPFRRPGILWCQGLVVASANPQLSIGRARALTMGSPEGHHLDPEVRPVALPRLGNIDARGVHATEAARQEAVDLWAARWIRAGSAALLSSLRASRSVYRKSCRELRLIKSSREWKCSYSLPAFKSF